MSSVQLHLPEGFESSISLTPAELESQVRLMAALKMFELHKLSSGRAAQLAGLTRAQFLEACAQYGIPVVDYPVAELDEEVEFLERWNAAQ